MSTIKRRRGDTYADEITVKSGVTGLPVNITGYTFTLTLDASKEPTSPQSNLYQISGSIIDAAAGRVEFAPTALQADRVGVFYYDIQMTDGAGRIRTIALAPYVYQQDLTK